MPCFGFGVWATHFVAMLAFSPGMPTAYDVPLTALSLIPGGWPIMAKAPFYLVAGILWAFFLPPLLVISIHGISCSELLLELSEGLILNDEFIWLR